MLKYQNIVPKLVKKNHWNKVRRPEYTRIIGDSYSSFIPKDPVDG
jgi:hypothetical protein